MRWSVLLPSGRFVPSFRYLITCMIWSGPKKKWPIMRTRSFSCLLLCPNNSTDVTLLGISCAFSASGCHWMSSGFSTPVLLNGNTHGGQPFVSPHLAPPPALPHLPPRVLYLQHSTSRVLFHCLSCCQEEFIPSLCYSIMGVGWLDLSTWHQRVTWEVGASTEEHPPSDWPVSISMWTFYRLMFVAAGPSPL